MASLLRLFLFNKTHNELKRKADPGQFKVFAGGNSRDVKEASFELK